jgi:hypothetical protein
MVSRNFLEKILKGTECLIRRQSGAGCTGNDVQIARMDQKATVEAKKDPDQALEPIADHRASHFTGNRNPQTRSLNGAGKVQGNKVPVGHFAARFCEVLEFAALSEPIIAGKSLVFQSWSNGLNRQTPAAFGPAAANQLAAIAGGHALTKTVRAYSADAVGLICSFHGRLSSFVSTRPVGAKSTGNKNHNPALKSRSNLFLRKRSVLILQHFVLLYVKIGFRIDHDGPRDARL